MSDCVYVTGRALLMRKLTECGKDSRCNKMKGSGSFYLWSIIKQLESMLQSVCPVIDHRAARVSVNEDQ